MYGKQPDLTTELSLTVVYRPDQASVSSKLSPMPKLLQGFFFVCFWIFFGPTWRSYKLTHVRSFVRSLPAFLEIGSFKFSDFWHKGALLYTLECDGARFSKKKKILRKLGPKNGWKTGFLDFVKNWIINFFWIFAWK